MTGTCPVCQEADTGTPLCTRCGRQLSGPLLLGGADPAMLAEFERDLEAAAHRWDATAASRAARVNGPAAAYAGLLRGTGDADMPADPEPRAPTRDTGLLGLLTQLVRGDLPMLHFVEFTPDAAVRVTVTADRAGVPTVAGGARSLPWNTAVLGADRLLRTFRLAGGVGDHPVDIGAFDATVARTLSSLLPDGPVVLVGRHPGWILLDRAAAALRRRSTPAAEVTAPPGEPLPDFVAGLLHAAPLAYDYVLLGMALDNDSGRVDLVPRTVFPAGTVVPSDRPLTQRIQVFGPPGAGPVPVTLPLLARRDDQVESWPVLRLPRLHLPGPGEHTVTISLSAPGDLSCTGPDAKNLEVTGTDIFRDALRRRATRIPVPPPLDLVCLVELCGGSRAEVNARLEILLATVDLLAERYARRRDLRVGAVGYFDHVHSEAKGDPPYELFKVAELSEPPTARRAVEHWRPATRQRDYATAVGDALSKANALRWRRDDERVEHAVLMIGRRPPEARTGQGDLIPMCPRHVDWHAETNRLHRLRARRVARIDLPTGWPGTDKDGHRARRYAEDTWKQLATDGLYREDGRPEQLADLITGRLDLPDRRTFPFPFLNPPGTSPEMLKGANR